MCSLIATFEKEIHMHYLMLMVILNALQIQVNRISSKWIVTNFLKNIFHH